jgi:hypothetical protein
MLFKQIWTSGKLLFIHYTQRSWYHSSIILKSNITGVYACSSFTQKVYCVTFDFSKMESCSVTHTYFVLNAKHPQFKSIWLPVAECHPGDVFWWQHIYIYAFHVFHPSLSWPLFSASYFSQLPQFCRETKQTPIKVTSQSKQSVTHLHLNVR